MHGVIVLFHSGCQKVVFLAGGKTHFAGIQRLLGILCFRLLRTQSVLGVIPGDVLQQNPVRNQNIVCFDGLHLIAGVIEGLPHLQLSARNVIGDIPILGGVLRNLHRLTVHVKSANRDDGPIRGQGIRVQDFKGGPEADTCVPKLDGVVAPVMG